MTSKCIFTLVAAVCGATRVRAQSEQIYFGAVLEEVRGGLADEPDFEIDLELTQEEIENSVPADPVQSQGRRLLSHYTLPGEVPTTTDFTVYGISRTVIRSPIPAPTKTNLDWRKLEIEDNGVGGTRIVPLAAAAPEAAESVPVLNADRRNSVYRSLQTEGSDNIIKGLFGFMVDASNNVPARSLLQGQCEGSLREELREFVRWYRFNHLEGDVSLRWANGKGDPEECTQDPRNLVLIYKNLREYQATQVAGYSGPAVSLELEDTIVLYRRFHTSFDGRSGPDVICKRSMETFVAHTFCLQLCRLNQQADWEYCKESLGSVVEVSRLVFTDADGDELNETPQSYDNVAVRSRESIELLQESARLDQEILSGLQRVSQQQSDVVEDLFRYIRREDVIWQSEARLFLALSHRQRNFEALRRVVFGEVLSYRETAAAEDLAVVPGVTVPESPLVINTTLFVVGTRVSPCIFDQGAAAAAAESSRVLEVIQVNGYIPVHVQIQYAGDAWRSLADVAELVTTGLRCQEVTFLDELAPVVTDEELVHLYLNRPEIFPCGIWTPDGDTEVRRAFFLEGEVAPASRASDTGSGGSGGSVLNLVSEVPLSVQPDEPAEFGVYLETLRASLPFRPSELPLPLKRSSAAQNATDDEAGAPGAWSTARPREAASGGGGQQPLGENVGVERYTQSPLYRIVAPSDDRLASEGNDVSALDVRWAPYYTFDGAATWAVAPRDAGGGDRLVPLPTTAVDVDRVARAADTQTFAASYNAAAVRSPHCYLNPSSLLKCGVDAELSLLGLNGMIQDFLYEIGKVVEAISAPTFGIFADVGPWYPKGRAPTFQNFNAIIQLNGNSVIYTFNRALWAETGAEFPGPLAANQFSKVYDSLQRSVTQDWLGQFRQARTRQPLDPNVAFDVVAALTPAGVLHVWQFFLEFRAQVGAPDVGAVQYISWEQVVPTKVIAGTGPGEVELAAHIEQQGPVPGTLYRDLVFLKGRDPFLRGAFSVCGISKTGLLDCVVSRKAGAQVRYYRDLGDPAPVRPRLLPATFRAYRWSAVSAATSDADGTGVFCGIGDFLGPAAAHDPQKQFHPDVACFRQAPGAGQTARDDSPKEIVENPFPSIGPRAIWGEYWEWAHVEVHPGFYCALGRRRAAGSAPAGPVRWVCGGESAPFVGASDLETFLAEPGGGATNSSASAARASALRGAREESVNAWRQTQPPLSAQLGLFAEATNGDADDLPTLPPFLEAQATSFSNDTDVAYFPFRRCPGDSRGCTVSQYGLLDGQVDFLGGNETQARIDQLRANAQTYPPTAAGVGTAQVCREYPALEGRNDSFNFPFFPKTGAGRKDRTVLCRDRTPLRAQDAVGTSLACPAVYLGAFPGFRWTQVSPVAGDADALVEWEVGQARPEQTSEGETIFRVGGDWSDLLPTVVQPRWIIQRVVYPDASVVVWRTFSGEADITLEFLPQTRFRGTMEATLSQEATRVELKGAFVLALYLAARGEPPAPGVVADVCENDALDAAGKCRTTPAASNPDWFPFFENRTYSLQAGEVCTCGGVFVEVYNALTETFRVDLTAAQQSPPFGRAVAWKRYVAWVASASALATAAIVAPGDPDPQATVRAIDPAGFPSVLLSSSLDVAGLDTGGEFASALRNDYQLHDVTAVVSTNGRLAAADDDEGTRLDTEAIEGVVRGLARNLPAGARVDPAWATARGLLNLVTRSKQYVQPFVLEPSGGGESQPTIVMLGLDDDDDEDSESDPPPRPLAPPFVITETARWKRSRGNLIYDVRPVLRPDTFPECAYRENSLPPCITIDTAFGRVWFLARKAGATGDGETSLLETCTQRTAAFVASLGALRDAGGAPPTAGYFNLTTNGTATVCGWTGRTNSHPVGEFGVLEVERALGDLDDLVALALGVASQTAQSDELRESITRQIAAARSTILGVGVNLKKLETTTKAVQGQSVADQRATDDFLDTVEKLSTLSRITDEVTQLQYGEGLVCGRWFGADGGCAGWGILLALLATTFLYSLVNLVTMAIQQVVVIGESGTIATSGIFARPFPAVAWFLTTGCGTQKKLARANTFGTQRRGFYIAHAVTMLASVAVMVILLIYVSAK
jgi:hypothetical protein